MGRILGATALAAITGCATSLPPSATMEDPGPEPSRALAEQLIRGHLERALKDPDSLKQLTITRAPYRKQYRALIGEPWRDAWVVCYEYNAKNSYGGYVGVKPAALTILNNAGTPRVLDTLPDFGLHLYC
jgi:hypothetical protein